MTLAHTSAREVAYCIIAALRGQQDLGWMQDWYNKTQRARLKSHLQFADFWYTGNGLFSDLRENTSKIAQQAGLTLNAEQAFRWLSTGGFANDSYESAQIGTWDVAAMKQLAKRFTGDEIDWRIGENNVFELDMEGAELDYVPLLHHGTIDKARCYRRGGKVLPNFGDFRAVISALRKESYIGGIIREVRNYFGERGLDVAVMEAAAMKTLEAMVTEGWVKASYDPDRKKLTVVTPEETGNVHLNRDPQRA